MNHSYRITLPVPVGVTWYYELVEEDDAFYVRLRPKINRGGRSGISRLKYMEEESKYISSQQRTADMRKIAKEVIEEIKKDKKVKEDLAKKLQDALKGKTVISVRSSSVFSNPLGVYGQNSKLNIKQVTKEDIAAGESLVRQEQKSTREELAEARLKAEQMAKTDEFAKQLLKGRKDKIE